MKLNKSLKIGITGRRGFIGGHITAALKNKGIKITFFDLPNNYLMKTGRNLENFVKNKDAIIHAAAINRGTDLEIIAGNVAATYNLISAMEKYNSKVKLIYLSSTQAELDTLYGKSKRLAEIMLEDFSKRNKIPVSIFRLINVFGEGCRPFYNSVVATFCYRAAKGKKLKVNGDKKFKFLYVDDLIKIILKEIIIKRKNLFYFKAISSKNEIAISDLAKLILSFKEKKLYLKSKFHKDLYKTY